MNDLKTVKSWLFPHQGFDPKRTLKLVLQNEHNSQEAFQRAIIYIQPIFKLVTQLCHFEIDLTQCFMIYVFLTL